MQLGLSRQYDATIKRYDFAPVMNDRRFSHTWVIGKTGVGKSTAMIRWAVDDILAGEGIAFFDPHGDAAEDIMKHIPRNRRQDVVYFNPYELAIGFNLFDNVPEERKSFVASSIVDSFKAVWGYSDITTPALDQFLYNGARAMMDMPDGTLFGLKFLLTKFIPSKQSEETSFEIDRKSAKFNYGFVSCISKITSNKNWISC